MELREQSCTDRRAEWLLVALGCGLWIVATALQWPIGPTFSDEVGYIGQSRLELQGTIRPHPDDVCHSVRTSRGYVASYPAFIPTLLVPLVALAPRGAFGLGVASALLLVFQVARALERAHVRPIWGLAILLHPTIALLSRTAMADLLVSAAGIAAWRSLAGTRWWRAAGWFGVLVAAKPVGSPLAAGLILGSAIAERIGLRDRGTFQLRAAAAGAVIGLLGVALMNVATVGGPQYAYVYRNVHFGVSYLATSGPLHLRTLLFLPPGLVLGALPLWKRREIGALLAAATLFALMAVYLFVDYGRNTMESLVVAPRLILPVVTILMVGWLEGASRWLPKPMHRLGAALLIMACGVVPFAVGSVHRRWQEPMRIALDTAERQMSFLDARVLGVSETAFKVGVMAHTKVLAVTRERPASVEVIVCSTESESHRASKPTGTCAFEGYRQIATAGPYRVLIRD